LTVLAVTVLALQLNSYSKYRKTFPNGLTVGGINVGGLSEDEAEQRISSIYMLELDLYYQADRVPLNPVDVEFAVDLETMMNEAVEQRDTSGFWPGFWDFLLGRQSDSEPIELEATYSETRLKAVLANISATRDQEPQPAVPVPTTLAYQEGEAGHQLDLAASEPLVAEALMSPSNRQVTLVVDQISPPAPGLETLGRLIDAHMSDYDGIYAVYVIDLETGESLGINEDVAFSGLSILKIPIIIETFRTLDNEPNVEQTKLLTETMVESGNYTANLLLDVIAGEDNGMLGAERVTDTLWKLGLTNTFIAVPYEEDIPGTYTTEANQRTDLNTHPDPKMQTTPKDMAMLLEMVYQCAAGGGTLLAAFPDDMRSDECQLMLEMMNQNRIGSLIEAGVPAGTTVAHKHGWGPETHGDAGIVFSDGGDYILVEYMYKPVWLEWAESSPLLAEISRATYNLFNYSQ
ncbi:MAG: serine hydrolase, partial [Chloroflexota bacterium]